MNYYRKYPGDYAADTKHLNPTEHGIYNLLMDFCYGKETIEIPQVGSRLYQICGATKRHEKEAVRSVVAEFFPGGINPRIKRQLADELALRDAAREKAKKGSEARWGASSNASGNASSIPASNAKGNARAMPTNTHSHSTTPPPTPTPTPTTTQLHTSRVASSLASRVPQKARKRASPRTTIPDEIDFPLSTGMIAVLLKSAPEADAGKEWQLFRDHHIAKGSTMASWEAAWRTWCNRVQRFGSNGVGQKTKFNAGEYMLDKVRKRYEQKN